MPTEREQVQPPSAAEDLFGYLTIGTAIVAAVTFLIPGLDIDELGLIPLTLGLWEDTFNVSRKKNWKTASINNSYAPRRVVS